MELNFGWQPEPPDSRDLKFSDFEPVEKPEYLPKIVDQSLLHTTPISQGRTGSCVGQAIKSAYEYLHRVFVDESEFRGSGSYAYANARLIGGKTLVDEGAYIRNGVKGVHLYGLCKEEVWPFEPTKINVRPPSEAYKEGNSRELQDYLKLRTAHEIKCALYYGYPVVVGFYTYSEPLSKSSRSGLITLPKDPAEEHGGHAVCLTGYNDYVRRWKFKNSWGTDWGATPYPGAKTRGFGFLDYDYIPKLSADYWCLRPKFSAHQT